MANKNLLVGLFVVAGLSLFTVGMYLIGDRHQAFSHHVDYYTEFINLGGMAKGSKVQVAGLDAGQVVEIVVPDSPSARFRVRFRIDEKLRGLVRTDSLATIGTAGVVGDTFLSIRTGSAKALIAPPLATLPSKEPVDISDLIDRGSGLLNDVDGTIKGLSQHINQALDGATTTLANVDDVVVGLKNGRGSAGMLLRDEALAGQIRHAVMNVDQATSDLNHTAHQADGLMSDIQSRQLPQKIDETLKSVHSAASNLDGSTQQIHQLIADVARPDEQGNSPGANIRESLSNANAATANMADDTEALKRGFFFRGFFRHRGYYNLAHISPEKYRQDRLFLNPSNYRAWLPGSDLFVTTSDGSEMLSTRGKHLLDDTIAKVGDSAIENPLVVEGYSSSDSVADQLSVSRRRALLVRDYLQNHFQLDPGNVGVVAMRNAPPAGMDHPAWDGVCVVIVSRRR